MSNNLKSYGRVKPTLLDWLIAVASSIIGLTAIWLTIAISANNLGPSTVPAFRNVALSLGFIADSAKYGQYAVPAVYGTILFYGSLILLVAGSVYLFLKGKKERIPGLVAQFVAAVGILFYMNFVHEYLTGDSRGSIPLIFPILTVIFIALLIGVMAFSIYATFNDYVVQTKAFLNKFRKFKFYTIIAFVAGLAGAIGSLALLFVHQALLTAVGFDGPQVGFFARPIEAMFFFLAGLFAVIFGIVVVYLSYPYLFKKEKMLPNKGIIYFAVAQAVLALVEAVFAVIMCNPPATVMYGGASKVEVAIALIPEVANLGILFAVITFVASLVEIAMLYPLFKVRIDDEK